MGCSFKSSQGQTHDEVTISYAHKPPIVHLRNGKGDKTRYVLLAPRTTSWLKVYYERVRPKIMNLKSGSAFFLDNQGLAFRPHQLTARIY